jgi:hypothetical protein
MKFVWQLPNSRPFLENCQSMSSPPELHIRNINESPENTKEIQPLNMFYICDINMNILTTLFWGMNCIGLKENFDIHIDKNDKYVT